MTCGLSFLKHEFGIALYVLGRENLNNVNVNEVTRVTVHACSSPTEFHGLHGERTLPNCKLSTVPFDMSRVKINVHLFGPRVVLGDSAYNNHTKSHDVS